MNKVTGSKQTTKTKLALMLINVLQILLTSCVSTTAQPTQSFRPTITNEITPTLIPSLPAVLTTKSSTPTNSNKPTQPPSVEETPTATSTPAKITHKNVTDLVVLAEWSVWEVKDIAWSPNSAIYAISFLSYEEENYTPGIKVFNAINLDEESLIENYYIDGITFNSDGQTIATSPFYDNVVIWDASTGQLVNRFANSKNKCLIGADEITYTPDGSTIVTNHNSIEPWRARIDFWNTKTRECLGKSMSLEGWLNSLQFSPDGQLLLTALGHIQNGEGQQTYLWDVNTGERVCTWSGGWASFSPMGDVVVIFGSEVPSALWDVETCQKKLSLQGNTKGFSFAFTPDGKLLATGDHWIKLWDTQSGQITYRFEEYYYSVDHLGFSPDGRYLLSFHGRSSAKEKGKIKLWAVKP
jgi:WD40 repeat protein